MKRYILASFALLSSIVATAQNGGDVDPLVSVSNKSENLRFTVGGRLMLDAAYIGSDYTPFRSGVALTDARIRTSLEYDKWYFYADFDFSRGQFKQKDIYARYSFANAKQGNHVLKLGYFAEPSSMAYNTSRYSYHFVNRANSVNVFAPKRAVGVSYKFYNRTLLFDQGIFAENKYNDQLSGFQGVSVSGRWLVRPINTDERTLHVGASLRYANIMTGTSENGILKTGLGFSSALENSVDTNPSMLNANIDWAKQTLDVNVEALYLSRRFFARGEYMIRKVYKERPDRQLFENQLGNNASWTTLEAWRKGNPLRTNTFSGGYIEAGFLILGDRYTYNNSMGVVNGNKAKNSLEVVARYNYTNLNDITPGDVFFAGRDQFYPGGVITDYPAASTSVGGGKLHSASVGLNYTLNQYIKFMIDYSYGRLDNYYKPQDKDFHTAQMRVMFSF